MAGPVASGPEHCTERLVLACRLRKKTTGRAAADSLAGELVLENVSSEDVEIKFDISRFQYLDMVVTDADGRVVSEGFYGSIFSPLEKPYIMRLRPGESYTGPVDLLGTVPQEKRLPGRYQVRAVYEYNGLRAISDPYLVEFKCPE